MNSYDFTPFTDADLIPAAPTLRADDLLFRNDLPDVHNNAHPNLMRDPGGGDDLIYSEGYLLAARHLVERVVTTGSDKNYLIYPIVFLYRHHIELVLKRLIRIARPPDAETLSGHDLADLWKRVRQNLPDLYEQIGWPEPDPQDLNGVDSYISQICKVDRSSTSFRYAQKKDGEPSLPADLNRINVRHFSQLMDGLARYLGDNFDQAVHLLQEHREEMARLELDEL